MEDDDLGKVSYAEILKSLPGLHNGSGQRYDTRADKDRDDQGFADRDKAYIVEVDEKGILNITLSAKE